ncbi:MAG: DUF1559 domain-containing protein [Planctomycetales bacterium]|nr:DUF1559 domain-containing protein [Planctomycetales bacterium]
MMKAIVNRRPVSRRDGVRKAFTIVELLVVIAIIGTLVSILLPAVNGVRKAARRTANENNLKQFGVALQSYEHTNNTFPPLVKYPAGAQKTSATLQRAVSWAFELLPFMEQQNVYDRFDPTLPCTDPKNQIAMASPIEIYACPQRRDAAASSPFISGLGTVGTLLDYAANGGVLVDSSGQPVKLQNNPASATLDDPYKKPFNAQFSGPFHHDFAVPTAAVRDGLGNTLAIGDRWIGPPVPTSGMPWNDLAGMAGESLPTLIRYANPDTQTSLGLPFPTDKTDTSIYKFGNVEGGEACFAFLDGHVRWIQYDIDPALFRLLSQINDHMPTPPLP